MSIFTSMFSKRQCGAAFTTMLIVILLLSLMSLLGISSVKSTVLQTQIARNQQLKQKSFLNADATVGIAEAEWAEKMAACFGDLASCTLDYTPNYLGEDLRQASYWADAEMVSEKGINFGTHLVEYFGRRPISGDAEREIHFFRITGRAFEAHLDDDGNPVSDSVTETVAQSMVRVCARIDGDGLC